MLEIIFILLGIVILFLVLIFKKQINNFYDNTKGLSETHANLYKNFVVYLVPVIFILAGIIMLITAKLSDETKQLIVQNVEANYFFGIGV